MSVVDEIKQKLDIVDVISGYVTLKKAGRSYKGICPFHAEKTPSFVVFPDTQSWHCFGACGTGGDAFSFVMQLENQDFTGALRLLAQRAGVSLSPRTETDRTEDRLKKRLRDINEVAAKYFHNLLLNSTAGETARSYLARREINRDTINRFQLGYALDDWQALGGYLQERGYQREDLLAAGLIIEREDSAGFSTGHYDRFRGRLIIPIRHERGGVIGFGARALDDSTPKYINSPQTPVFDKSSVLFGLDLAKGAIRQEGLAIIVEGYVDVLMAHQHQMANIVASMGTALTETQLKLLKRFSKRFALALDADTAGHQATLRSMALAQETLAERVVPVPTARGLIKYESRLDVDIRIITLPQGQDPDQVIRGDAVLWARLIENALPIVEYYFQVITSEVDLESPKGKAEAVRKLMPIIQEIGDTIEREHYIQKLARLVRVDEKTLLRQARVKGERVKRDKSEKRESLADRERLVFKGEEYCLSTLLRKPHLLQSLNDALRNVGVDGLNADDFAQAENRAIFAGWLKSLGPKDSGGLREKLDSILHPRLDLLLEGPKGAPPTNDDQVEKALIRVGLLVRQRQLHRLIEELRFLQVDAVEVGGDAVEEYGQVMNSYLSAKWRIDQALHSNSFFGRSEANLRRTPGLVP